MLKNKEEEKMAVAYAKDVLEIDMNRTIEKKDESIRNLSNMLQRNRAEMEKGNDRLYVINEELAEEKLRRKETEEEMFKQNKLLQWLEIKVKELEGLIQQEKEKYEALVEQHEREILSMEEQHQKEVRGLVE
jgi:chromosome segregation ATPase